MRCYADYTVCENEEREKAVKKLLANPDSFEEKSGFYNSFYKDTPSEEIENIEKVIREFGDQVAKDLEFLKIDIFACANLYGASVKEYFVLKLYEKNDLGRREYMFDKERFSIFRPFYDFSKYEKVRNKWEQYKILKQYFQRECLCFSDKINPSYKEFYDFILRCKKFIWKPVRASCGKDVCLININDRMDLSCLYNEIIYRGGVLDEYIVQHTEMEKFHPNSVNSIRLIAFHGNDGQNYYTHALFKMGQSEEIVDNSDFSIRARVDEQSGYVYTCGTDSYGKRYILHPDTGVPIAGFKIPQWNELLNIAGRIMNQLSSYARLIGFDFALTKKGWIVVEINPFPQMTTYQILNGRGSKKYLMDLIKKCTVT